MVEYCDPDMTLITETKLDSIIYSSELLPKGYVGEFRRDQILKRWRGHDSDEGWIYYY